MSSRFRIALLTGRHSCEIGIFGAGAGGAATAVAVTSDIVAIARDRAAIVPPPVLTPPRVILGLEAATNLLITTVNAEPAKPAEHAGEDFLRGLSDLCVDRRPYAEAV